MHDMTSTLATPRIAGDVSPAAPHLAEGIELLGTYKNSGCVEAPSIIRCADGRMLEVSPLLHQLALNLDGAPDLDVVATRMSADLGRRISSDSVAYLIDNKLRPLGLIADSTTTSPPQATPALLGLTLHAGVVPASVVRAFTAVLRPLFLPAVVVVVLVTLLAADVLLLLTQDVGQGVNAAFSNPTLLLLVVALTVIASGFHELGHATASRYGGAEPGVIGAGIYLIWPVFYNDLNDSHRLGRTGRLRCDLGGVYFNVIFILVVAGLYGLTGFEPLLVVVAVQHLVILQQFLPFVRLDGYYVVSDIAGVPVLFGRIKPIMSSLVPGRPAVRAVTDLRARARRIVTAWVLISVPLLALCLLLLIFRMPSLAMSTVDSLTAHADALARGLGAGAYPTAALSGVQLFVLAVPVVGLCVTLLRVLSRCRRTRLHHRLGGTILRFGAPSSPLN